MPSRFVSSNARFSSASSGQSLFLPTRSKLHAQRSEYCFALQDFPAIHVSNLGQANCTVASLKKPKVKSKSASFSAFA